MHPFTFALLNNFISPGHLSGFDQVIKMLGQIRIFSLLGLKGVETSSYLNLDF